MIIKKISKGSIEKEYVYKNSISYLLWILIFPAFMIVITILNIYYYYDFISLVVILIGLLSVYISLRKFMYNFKQGYVIKINKQGIRLSRMQLIKWSEIDKIEIKQKSISDEYRFFGLHKLIIYWQVMDFGQRITIDIKGVENTYELSKIIDFFLNIEIEHRKSESIRKAKEPIKTYVSFK